MEVDGSKSMCEESRLKEILHFVEGSVQAWYRTIKTFGVDDEAKAKWETELQSEIEHCLNYCNAQAQLKQQELNDKIASLLEELQKMCVRLGVKMPQFAPTNMGLYNDEKYLIKEVKGMQEEIDRRMIEIDDLKARRDEISKSLGRKEFFIRESPLPSQEELISYRTKVRELEVEKQRRIEKFRHLQEQIAEMAAEIQFEPKLDFERDIIYGDNLIFFEGTDENMQRVVDFHQELIEKRDNIVNDLDKLRETVQHLWKVLDEDVMHCNAFVRDNIGHTLNTLEAFKQEVKRCEEIRKTNLKKFIEKMRAELVELWNQAGFSDDRRGYFEEHMLDDLYTEDLLTLHDLQIERVKNYLQKHSVIFDCLKERDVLFKKMRRLEERTNAPDRYKNRGGQLLKEEKERKAVSKKIPEVEEKLLELAAQYELEHAEKFMFLDESIESMITKEREIIEQERKLQLSARKLKRDEPMSASKLVTPRRLYKSPSVLISSQRKFLTPHNTKTPMRTPKTAPVRKVLTGRRSITKAKIRLSADKRKRVAAMRAQVNVSRNLENDPEYSQFEKEVSEKDSARSTISLHSAPYNGNVLPSIHVETPRTVNRHLKYRH